MVKNFFLFFWALALFATFSKAQVSSVTGQYLQDNNLLLNPGFESGIGKWTNSAGTFTADYSVFVQGKASGKVVLSSQALNFFQDSTLFASQLADGMQAILTVKIKSSVAGVKVCPRQAGSVITSLCIDVQGNNKWGLYQIPFVTGATSQGISINSNGNSITGTVYVDESYVGVTNILNSSSEAKLAGEAFFAGTINCQWSRTSTTVGSFPVDTDCPGPTIVQQNLGQWQTTDSDLPRVTVNNLPAGTYKATFTFMNNVTSGNPALSITDGTTTCEPVPGNGSTTSNALNTVSCSFQYVSSGNRSFEIVTGATAGAVVVANSVTTPRSGTKFILEYYGSNSTYTTLNADTDWASCGHTTSSFTGFGTVSAIETQCKRQGSDLLMRGKFTVGTTTATEARLSLPLWNGLQIVAKSSVIPSIQNIGHWWGSNPLLVSGSVLINSNLSYITFASGNQGNNGFSGLNGSAMQSSTLPIGFESRIPIEGWQNSNIIIGQFNGLEKCTDSYECTDVFSANVSSGGTVSNENIDWINGNISPSSNLYPISFKTGVFTVAPNCVATATSTSIVTIQEYTAATNSGVTMATIAGGAGSPQAFKIVCQKQGVDYIGKTAKAVASDQNVRTPSVTKAVIYSAAISTSGALDNEIGDFINGSCTNAAPNVCTFNSNTWASTPICMVSFTTNANCACRIDSVSTSSVSINCKTLGSSILDCAISTGKSITCHGVSP
jgi:hypothetical protein